MRQNLNWPHAAFEIPEDIKTAWNAGKRGDAYENEWQTLFSKYQQAHPQLAEEFLRRTRKKDYLLASNVRGDQFIKETQETLKTDATRKSSLACIEEFSELLPELLGGSADLSGSNCTKSKSAKSFKPRSNRKLHPLWCS